LPCDGAAAETDGAPIVPLPNVLATDTDLSVLASEERIAAEQQMGQIAREAITLLYPDPATQTAPVPPAFSATDNILVFTDFRLQRECATCEQEPSVGPDEVARIIERLYGSQSAGVIDPNNIVSKTFVELTALLDSLDQRRPHLPQRHSDDHTHPRADRRDLTDADGRVGAGSQLCAHQHGPHYHQHQPGGWRPSALDVLERRSRRNRRRCEQQDVGRHRSRRLDHLCHARRGAGDGADQHGGQTAVERTCRLVG
jgi:hypothetical protein